MVAVLYARADSHYRAFNQADVWDACRDARRWPGGAPVIAHPPCRAWARLRHMAKPRPDEKKLALHAVDCVRQHGGVLEHPAHSTLWAAAGLPLPGQGTDKWGGWTFPVWQFWWGHRAAKATWLYIVGARPADMPAVPFVLGNAPCVIGSSGKRKDGTRAHRPETTKAEREHTPEALCAWLLELAQRCSLVQGGAK